MDFVSQSRSRAQNNIKISIANINYSQDQFNKYGTFDVLVRQANDTDAAPIVLERFSNCNLDANSLDYVARKIGDSYVRFNATTRRLETRGDYPNSSKYIRIEMAADEFNEELLPFGYYGPLKYKDATISNTTNFNSFFDNNAFLLGAKQFMAAGLASGQLIVTGSGIGLPADDSAPELKLLFPSHELRLSGSQDGLADQTDAYWGVWTGRTKTIS